MPQESPLAAWREQVVRPLIEGETFNNEHWDIGEDDPEKPLVVLPRGTKLRPMRGADFAVEIDGTRSRLALLAESGDSRTTIISVGEAGEETPDAVAGSITVFRTVRRVGSQFFKKGPAHAAALYGRDTGALETVEVGVPNRLSGRLRRIEVAGIPAIVAANPLLWTQRDRMERWAEASPGTLDSVLDGTRQHPMNRIGIGVDLYRNTETYRLARAELLYRRKGERRDTTHRAPMLPDVPLEATPEELFRVFQRAMQVVLGIKVEQPPQAKDRVAAE